jgi:hypothetical protein
MICSISCFLVITNASLQKYGEARQIVALTGNKKAVNIAIDRLT